MVLISVLMTKFNRRGDKLSPCKTPRRTVMGDVTELSVEIHNNNNNNNNNNNVIQYLEYELTTRFYQPHGA